MIVNNPNINPYQQHYQQPYGSHHQAHMMHQLPPQHSQSIQIMNNQGHFQPSPLHPNVNHIPQATAARVLAENTVTETSQNDEKDDDDEYDEYENKTDDQHLYVSIDLNAAAVQKLKSLNLEQCTYLKQLGILSIQFENEKYNLSLMSPPVKRRRRSSSVKPSQIVNNATMNKKDELPAASFTYIPTSGLTLDESNQYVNLAYLGGQPGVGKQQFAMPCPMLKNLLKTESGHQNIEIANAQSDELLRIIRIRQALATQTQQQEAQVAAATAAAAAANANATSASATTTVKKPRNRAQPDKPKQKRTSKANKSGEQQSADNNKSGQSGESSTPKKDHHTQEKIRNILNDAQNYQQMTMMNQLGQQQQIIQHQQQQQQQPIYQMSQMSVDINKPQQQTSNSFYGTDQQQNQQPQQQQIAFISQQLPNNISNQNQHIPNNNVQISNGI